MAKNSINVKDDETYARITKLAGQLQAERGKRVKLEEAVKYLLDEHDRADGQGGNPVKKKEEQNE